MPGIPNTLSWAFPGTNPPMGTSCTLIQQVPFTPPITLLDLSYCPCHWRVYNHILYEMSGSLVPSLLYSYIPLELNPFLESPAYWVETKFLPHSYVSYLFPILMIFFLISYTLEKPLDCLLQLCHKFVLGPHVLPGHLHIRYCSKVFKQIEGDVG